MFGTTGDAVLSCLVAAVLVIVAHGLDTLGARRRGSWANSLALALCALAMVLLVVQAFTAEDRTTLLLLCATLVAVGVSALPLFGVGVSRAEPAPAPPLDPTPPRPVPARNPWDRTFKVRRNKAAELLGIPMPRPRPVSPVATAPTQKGTTTSPPDPEAARSTVRRGVVLEDGRQEQNRRRGPFPEVDKAEETLEDVGEMIGDLGRLLGLDRRDRH